MSRLSLTLAVIGLLALGGCKEETPPPAPDNSEVPVAAEEIKPAQPSFDCAGTLRKAEVLRTNVMRITETLKELKEIGDIFGYKDETRGRWGTEIFTISAAENLHKAVSGAYGEQVRQLALNNCALPK